MRGNTIYFDLTEAQLASSKRRIQYYGIARTVVETAKAAALLDPNIRFIVFSFGHGEFFEVPWSKDDNGSISFSFPLDLEQRWFRTHYGHSRILSALTKAIGVTIASRNRRLWNLNGGDLKRIDVSDGTVFSAGRPKLIVDMIKALKRAGSSAQIIPLLHDFMPLHIGVTKRFRRFDRNFLHDNRFVISHSAGVITNSQFTKEELERFSASGHLPAPKYIDAVPLVHQCPDGEEAPQLAIPEEPYLLTVGLNLGRKNIEVVLDALNVMARDGTPLPKLLIAGAHRKKLANYVASPDYVAIRDHIMFINNPNQTDLVRLYQQALALVIPSRIEGWGLPAGEALWCGTPAICSTAPVLREVCGDLGLYFDPDDSIELASLVQKLMSDEGFRQDLRDKIKARKQQLRNWMNVSSDILVSINKK